MSLVGLRNSCGHETAQSAHNPRLDCNHEPLGMLGCPCWVSISGPRAQQVLQCSWLPDSTQSCWRKWGCVSGWQARGTGKRGVLTPSLLSCSLGHSWRNKHLWTLLCWVPDPRSPLLADELTVPRYRTEKPSKSPPPPPPRRSFPSSHGLTTTRTGEVVVTSKKDSAFIKVHSQLVGFRGTLRGSLRCLLRGQATGAIQLDF